MKFKFISAQPATDYYAWQVEVYLDNFISLGYNEADIDVVCSIQRDSIPDSWMKLASKHPMVRFSFYIDNDPNRNYLPAVQAHILKHHFSRYRELEDYAIFFHDCDFVFTKYFDFEPYLNDDNWYFSNVDHYIGADYLESKGYKKDDNSIMLLDMMAKVVGICACKVRANRGRAGGAQKLMKKVTSEYWKEVEEDSINLYNWLLQNKDDYGDSDVNDIQIWTASMWSELWNAWKRGKNVMTPKEFDFCWATDHESKWYDKSFFHNAGVVDDKSGMFFKSSYVTKLPYNEDLDIDPDRCSKMYYDIVKNVGENSVLL